MEYFRPLQAAVVSRSLMVAIVCAGALSIFLHQYLPAAALCAGCLIGLASLFHIAGGFNRLVKGGKRYLPFTVMEALLRVLLAGAAPALIVANGPWLGYFTYLAGFVAPLAVAIIVYRQQIVYGRTSAAA